MWKAIIIYTVWELNTPNWPINFNMVVTNLRSEEQCQNVVVGTLTPIKTLIDNRSVGGTYTWKCEKVSIMDFKK